MRRLFHDDEDVRCRDRNDRRSRIVAVEELRCVEVESALQDHREFLSVAYERPRVRLERSLDLQDGERTGTITGEVDDAVMDHGTAEARNAARPDDEKQKERDRAIRWGEAFAHCCSADKGSDAG